MIRAPHPHLPLQEHAELAEKSNKNLVLSTVEGAPLTSSPASTTSKANLQSSQPGSVVRSSTWFTGHDAANQSVSLKAASPLPGSVTFPEPAAADAIARPSNPFVDSSTPAAYRVLLVEDNSVNMKLLTTILKRLRFPNQEAHDGIEAVKRFVALKLQLVLLDMSMPRMDGFEAALHMRAHDLQPRPRIVAITALSSTADRARGLECGCDEWRTEPHSIRALKIDPEQ